MVASSEVAADARGHVIPGLKGQSREEMCRLIISHQILMDQLGHRNPFGLPAPIAHLCKIVSYRICRCCVYVTVQIWWRGSRTDASETKGGFKSLHIQYMWNVLIQGYRAAGSGWDYSAVQRLMMRKLMKDGCLASLDLRGCTRKYFY